MIVACPGCGDPREIALQTFLNNGKKVRPCKKCRDRQVVEGEPVRVNGCVLLPTRGPSRCALAHHCQNYTSCLDAAVRADWEGWTT